MTQDPLPGPRTMPFNSNLLIGFASCTINKQNISLHIVDTIKDNFAISLCMQAWGESICTYVHACTVQSTGWPGVVAVMGNWFGKKRRGLLLGVWNSHTSVGNILGTVVPAIWAVPGRPWSVTLTACNMCPVCMCNNGSLVCVSVWGLPQYGNTCSSNDNCMYVCICMYVVCFCLPANYWHPSGSCNFLRVLFLAGHTYSPRMRRGTHT